MSKTFLRMVGFNFALGVLFSPLCFAEYYGHTQYQGWNQSESGYDYYQQAQRLERLRSTYGQERVELRFNPYTGRPEIQFVPSTYRHERRVEQDNTQIYGNNAYFQYEIDEQAHYGNSLGNRGQSGFQMGGQMTGGADLNSVKRDMSASAATARQLRREFQGVDINDSNQRDAVITRLEELKAQFRFQETRLDNLYERSGR